MGSRMNEQITGYTEQGANNQKDPEITVFFSLTEGFSDIRVNESARYTNGYV